MLLESHFHIKKFILQELKIHIMFGKIVGTPYDFKHNSLINNSTLSTAPYQLFGY